MLSIYKIEVYNKLQKELQERKRQQVNSFVEAGFITLAYNAPTSWVYADWKGYQTEGCMKAGCEKISEVFLKYQWHAVHNYNTNVSGIRTPGASWVGRNWFAQMEQAGLKKFAWIYSSSAMSQVSTKEFWQHTPNAQIFCSFHHMNAT